MRRVGEAASTTRQALVAAALSYGGLGRSLMIAIVVIRKEYDSHKDPNCVEQKEQEARYVWSEAELRQEPYGAKRESHGKQSRARDDEDCRRGEFRATGQYQRGAADEQDPCPRTRLLSLQAKRSTTKR